MSSTLITNKTNLLAFKDMLKQISLDEKSIIIVPDKFSLNAEKMFFEEKNVLATFSTQVFSITKLASKVLEKELKNKKLIDKNVSLMIVSNIISENLHNFKYFKNIKDINKISEDIFNVISQMLSSQVCDFSEELCGNLKVKFEGDEFLNFANMLKNRSSYKFNTSISINDKILTLSTCYNKKEKLVLHGKLIKQEKR